MARNPEISPGDGFTKSTHKESYPTISPTRPELSQAGKTVLVTGASEGIGYAIVKAFVEASAAKIVLVSRTQSRLDNALSSLKEGCPGAKTHLVAVSCDMANTSASASLWDSLEANGTVVDVLCLNAGSPTEPGDLLDRGSDRIFSTDLAMNLRAQLYFVERFYKQRGQGAGCPKYLVHTSTKAIYEYRAPAPPGYSPSKLAFSGFLQSISRGIPADRMQVVQFHPGAILTRAAREVGCDEHSHSWIRAEVPGRFAVWAASPEASFLHGRFVWAEWDMEELRSGDLRKKIDEDPFFLTIGIIGL